MDPPSVLLAYYSRTGNTRRVARAIASSIPCAMEEIVDDRDRRGVVGYFRSGYEAWFRRPVAIRRSRFAPEDHDLVIIGTPIWNASVPSPVRAYLRRHRGHLRDVAFAITCGGFGVERATRQLIELAGHPPRAVLTLRERDLDDVEARAAAFAADLERALRAPVAA